MDAPQSSIFPIHKVPYSNGIMFYWTIWNSWHRVPLIKYGDIFVPVNEHHTLIVLATKIIAIANLRVDGEHPNSRDTTQSFQGMVMGLNFSCQNELNWGAIVFGDNDINFKYYRDMATKELAKIIGEH